MSRVDGQMSWTDTEPRPGAWQGKVAQPQGQQGEAGKQVSGALRALSGPGRGLHLLVQQRQERLPSVGCSCGEAAGVMQQEIVASPAPNPGGATQLQTLPQKPLYPEPLKGKAENGPRALGTQEAVRPPGPTVNWQARAEVAKLQLSEGALPGKAPRGYPTSQGRGSTGALVVTSLTDNHPDKVTHTSVKLCTQAELSPQMLRQARRDHLPSSASQHGNFPVRLPGHERHKFLLLVTDSAAKTSTT
ncbi:hypothetical protein P7K49_014894 [Saguinus oedipus]|uniref:Uncharacterized protein n=1 Tax=Saguinus oedipus TaxID=9490 RepID=A0ABQ9V7R2_SAGOE|nr:hypothetical protein P7K49_014894 [Saguinus oedipus]